MATLHFALTNRAQVPDRDALEQAFKTLKFKLSLDDGYQPFVTQGYLPCTLNGEDGGIDIRFDKPAGYLEKHPQIQAWIEQCDTLIAIRGGGDPREDVCALMVGATLAQAFGMTIFDAKRASVLEADALLNQARKQFNELDF